MCLEVEGCGTGPFQVRPGNPQVRGMPWESVPFHVAFGGAMVVGGLWLWSVARPAGLGGVAGGRLRRSCWWRMARVRRKPGFLRQKRPFPMKLQSSALRQPPEPPHPRLGMLHTRLGMPHTRLGSLHSKLGMPHTRLGSLHTKLGLPHSRLGLLRPQLGMPRLQPEMRRFRQGPPRLRSGCARLRIAPPLPPRFPARLPRKNQPRPYESDAPNWRSSGSLFGGDARSSGPTDR